MITHRYGTDTSPTQSEWIVAIPSETKTGAEAMKNEKKKDQFVLLFILVE